MKRLLFGTLAAFASIHASSFAEDLFVFKASIAFEVTSVQVNTTSADKLIKKSLATRDLVNLALGRPLSTPLDKTKEILAVLGTFEDPSAAPVAKLVVYDQDANAIKATVATLSELDYSLAFLNTSSKGQGFVSGDFVATTQGTPTSNGLLASKFHASGKGGGPHVSGIDLSLLRPSGSVNLQGRLKFNFTDKNNQLVNFDGFLTKGTARASGRRIGVNPTTL